MAVLSVWPFTLRGTVTHPQAKPPETVTDCLAALIAEDGGDSRRIGPGQLELVPVARSAFSLARRWSRVASFSKGTFSISKQGGQTAVDYAVPNGSAGLAYLLFLGAAFLLSSQDPLHDSGLAVNLLEFWVVLYVVGSALAIRGIRSLIREALDTVPGEGHGS